MKDHILRCYEVRKKESGEINSRGWKRYDRKEMVFLKSITIMCLILGIILVGTYFYYQTTILTPIGISIIFTVGPILLYQMDLNNQRKNWERDKEKTQKKIGLLGTILSEDFNIQEKEQVNHLIHIYQEYLDRHKENVLNAKAQMYVLLSIVGGVVSITFVNMNILGLDFVQWFTDMFVIGVLVLGIGGAYCIPKMVDPNIRKYEMMVNDLMELQLIECRKM